MEGITAQASQILERALQLSPHDRGVLIARLIDSMEEGPGEEGVEAAWETEIKTRVEEIRSGKARLISSEEVRRRALARLRDAER